ncbi:MAG TPA: hypothetical protein VGV59_19475 [Pyrinomonadaceae bacterium]|nr:hypothetical protein [Pyrinomonadaceae bacterium]
MTHGGHADAAASDTHAPHAGQADAAAARLSANRAERPEEGRFLLPCGYVDGEGVLHEEVELAPLDGRDEEYLACMRADASTAAVVTGLLSRCVKRLGSFERIDAALVRDLNVCDRDYLIIKARQMTFGAKVEAVLGCENEQCGAPLDVSFFLDELHIERKPAHERFFDAPLSSPVEMRLPTGGDQEALAAVYRTDHERSLRLLLARCLRCAGDETHVEEAFVERLSPDELQAIETEMARRTPQVGVELEGTCPECRAPFSTTLDFTAFFATELRSGLAALEREVHTLARYYHWSEQEILSLPRPKRRRYLALIREGLEGFD